MVSQINFYFMVGFILHFFKIFLLFVFVFIMMRAGCNIRKNSRACRKSSGSFSKHKLFVVKLALYNYPIVLIFHIINVFSGTNQPWNYKEGKRFVVEF